jgi:GNAT superfamily N-acetyltransferase
MGSVFGFLAAALAAASAYFGIVFGVGFLLGAIRVPLLVPRIGERYAELAEMPLMFVAIFLAAGYVLRRFSRIRTPGAWLLVGFLALTMLVLSELLLAVVLSDRGIVEYIASRDPVSGSVYLGMLIVFAIMPRLRSKPASVLRQAVVRDIPGIWKVRYSVTENTLTPGRLSDEDVRESIEDTGRGWVIEEGGEIQAFAVGNAKTGNVWALFVKPEAQGRGHGSRLHAAMIEWFQTQAIDRLWLSTGTETKARAFYEKNGWACVGPYGADEVRYERLNTPSSGNQGS